MTPFVRFIVSSIPLIFFISPSGMPVIAHVRIPFLFLLIRFILFSHWTLLFIVVTALSAYPNIPQIRIVFSFSTTILYLFRKNILLGEIIDIIILIVTVLISWARAIWYCWYIMYFIDMTYIYCSWLLLWWMMWLYQSYSLYFFY